MDLVDKKTIVIANRTEDELHNAAVEAYKR